MMANFLKCNKTLFYVPSVSSLITQRPSDKVQSTLSPFINIYTVSCQYNNKLIKLQILLSYIPIQFLLRNFSTNEQVEIHQTQQLSSHDSLGDWSDASAALFSDSLKSLQTIIRFISSGDLHLYISNGLDQHYCLDGDYLKSSCSARQLCPLIIFLINTSGTLGNDDIMYFKHIQTSLE